MQFHSAQVCSGAVTTEELNGLEEVSASCVGRISGHRTSTECVVARNSETESHINCTDICSACVFPVLVMMVNVVSHL